MHVQELKGRRAGPPVRLGPADVVWPVPDAIVTAGACRHR